MGSKRDTYRVVAFYDTETTNLHTGMGHKAFPVLFILNNTGCINYKKYTDKDDHISFYRYEGDFLTALDDIVTNGISDGYIPIVAAYNLMFDLQPILWLLKQRYDFEILAQSSTHVYTLDLVSHDTGKKVLRFWDMFFLEQNGLAAMGEICGTEKLTGSWDYNLIRNQDTPITDIEYEYARNDVRVMPSYLRYLLESNDFLRNDDLGVSCMTKTGVVRLMGKRVIGKRRIKRDSGYSSTVYSEFLSLCEREQSKSYGQYATRKACFYGGYTFTSARYASTIQEHVSSLDVVSMHHLFIDGRMVPVNFSKVPTRVLDKCVNDVIGTTLDYILDHYEKPFTSAFHACIEFDALRLKEGTVFEHDGIALVPRSKFGKQITTFDKYGNLDTTRDTIEDNNRRNGYTNHACNCIFAYGKLYKADKCRLWLNEVELWNVSQVYQWDNIECVSGEVSVNFVKPPDYVTLQSNMLFALKNEMKHICKDYREGVPYDKEVSDMVPVGLAKGLKDGTVSSDLLHAYYVTSVKGMFNGIYGTMAQDVMKPDYISDFDANIFIDSDTVPSDANFDDVKPEQSKVLYTYGMRIVAGSRMHLVIAIKLLGESGACILGGDTDSIKMTYGTADRSYIQHVAMKALEPLHNAATLAIMRAQERVRTHYSDIASDFEDVGCFEIENDIPYRYHVEYWNKCRISVENDMTVHVTCAGLSRPKGSYNIETMLSVLIPVYGIECLPHVFGYNTIIYPSISHNLEKHIPKPHDMVDENVTDHNGNVSHVNAHESVALYESAKIFGDTSKQVNHENVSYSERLYATAIDTDCKMLTVEDGYYKVVVNDETRYRAHV